MKRSFGKKIIVASAIAAVISMFLGWAEARSFTRTGLQLSLFFLLAFWVYPVIVTTFDRLINIKWANMMAFGSVVGTVIVILVIGEKSGALVKVDTGVGAWLFLGSGIALWIGTNLYAKAGRLHPPVVDAINDIDPRREATTELGAGMKEEESEGRLFSVRKTIGTLYGRLTGRAANPTAHSQDATDHGELARPNSDANLAAIASLESRVINTESLLVNLQNGVTESLLLGQRIRDDHDTLVLKLESYQVRVRNLSIGLGLALVLSFVMLILPLVR